MKKHLLIILLTFIILSLTACDSGLLITEISIKKYPERIVYYANIDTELDMTGCEVEINTKEGTKSVVNVLSDEFDMYYTVTESIDFNKSGVYKVIISRGDLSCSFAIEVIDK